MTGRENMSPMRPYWSPYLAGVALGLTLLATYLLMRFGLGASGAFAQVAARLEGAVAPGRAHANPYLVGYLEAGRLWAQWIVVEMVGVIVGAVLGAWTAGRFAWRLEKGPRIGAGRRLLFAFIGGATVGFASRVAHWATLPRRCSKNVLFEGISRYCPVADRRSCRQCAIVFLGRRPRDRASWGGVDLDGFGESQGRLPRDGHRETCSPDSNNERPRPATGCRAKGN